MLEFRSIADLSRFKGGALDTLFRNQLDMVKADLMAVPGSKQPRKVVIELSFEPVSSTGKELEEVKVTSSVRFKLPTPTLPPIVMSAADGGVLVWNPASPANPQQRTLDALLPAQNGDDRNGQS